MAKRYTITIHDTDYEEYDIDHEADEVFLSLASSLVYGSPWAKEEWAPYQELWPDLMEIPDTSDLPEDDESEGSEEFSYLRYADTEPDIWPGRRQFWGDAMSLRLDGVGLSGGGSPASGMLYRIYGKKALRKVMRALKDKYKFELGRPR